ncbi:hypothetical protein [Natronoglycomyces albus]|uniref:SHOCT domain-containing protein n=1 Tax=Natronoglycomyces albus TaxID=2811108 RepID=A0A895XPY8_9ACTN|nr:hypothetical protein [Natronoglycomyces albus]QSB05792.1 hypothetical protein JQS30_02345 [Natronoglycomyces albus]
MPPTAPRKSLRVSGIIRPPKLVAVLNGWGIIGGIVAVVASVILFIATFLPWAQYRPLQEVNLWNLAGIDDVQFGAKVWLFVAAWAVVVVSQFGYLLISSPIAQVWLVAASMVGWVFVAIGFLGVLAVSRDLGPLLYGFYLAAVAHVIVLAGTAVAWSSISPSAPSAPERPATVRGHAVAPNVDLSSLSSDRLNSMGEPPAQASGHDQSPDLESTLRRLGEQRDKGQISASEYEMYANNLRSKRGTIYGSGA